MSQVLKKLLIVCSIVLLLCSNIYAMTLDQFKEAHQTGIVKACIESWEEGTASRYGCMLNEFHALHKVMDYLITVDGKSDDWKVLMGLFKVHIWPEYKTFDFLSIHIEFEEYLKSKQN